MASYAHYDVLKNGPQEIKDKCNLIILITTYTPGDTYAIVAGKELARIATVPGDFSISASGSNTRLTSPSGREDNNATGGGAAGHVAFLDTSTSRVLAVTEETTNRTVVPGDTIKFPRISYTSKQPTMV